MISGELVSRASTAVDRALAFIERDGIETYDPLDLSTHEISQRLLTVRTRVGTLIRRAIWAGAYVAPQLTRRWLGVKRSSMHSGVANLASAYLELGGEKNLAKARRWLDWLEANAIRTESYCGWGFPFPWKQKLMVLPGTPIGHTTMTCANVFLKYSLVAKSASALQVADAACNTFHHALRHTTRPSGSIAVSYTPLDETQIINVQADVASLLIRMHGLTGDQRHYDLGSRLLRCVLETQNADGSWGYFAPDTTLARNFVDNHHTGMVLSALAEISACKATNGEDARRLETTLHSGTAYFLENLFTEEGVPKYLDTTIYPIEIYNFAQSIITCLDLISVSEKEVAERLAMRVVQLVEQLLQKMQLRTGGFLYRRTKWLNQNLGSLRWANALTVAALARWVKESGTINQQRSAAVFQAT